MEEFTQQVTRSQVMELVRIGDVVHLQAGVLDVFPSDVGILVELASLTGCTAAMVRPSDVVDGPDDDWTRGYARIRGTVVGTNWPAGTLPPGAEFEIELFSKTEQYRVRVIPAHVIALVLPVLPAEPPTLSWVVGVCPDDDVQNVWHRDDANCPDVVNREGRRFPRRWLDVAARRWVGWDEAVRRGADPQTRLAPVVGTATSNSE